MSESSSEQSFEDSESQCEYYGTSDFDYSHNDSDSDNNSETSHRSERLEILESTETIINSKFNIYSLLNQIYIFIKNDIL